MLDKLNHYKKELSEIHNNLKATKEQIQQLNVRGEQLTARGNFVRGKIELLEELIKEEQGQKGTVEGV